MTRTRTSRRRGGVVRVALATVFLLLIPSIAQAAPGDLDPSFSGDGKVTTDFGSGADIARAVVRQPDGKLVVAGRAKIGGTFDFALAPYNTDGTLDPAFGIGGKVTTDFASNLDDA